MEKRLILAIALSMLIILFFQHFVAKPPPKPVIEKPPEEPTTAIVSKEPEKTFEEEEFVAETDRFTITFSNIGGSIKKILLKDYKTSDANGPLELINVVDPKEYVFAVNDLAAFPSLDTMPYKFKRTADEIEFSLATKDVEITKRYILHNSKNIIELQLFVKNVSAVPQSFNFKIIGGAGLTEPNPQDRRFVEVTSNVGGRALNFKRPRKGDTIINQGIVSWTALKNKYFSLILKPLVSTKRQFYNEKKDGYLVMGVDAESQAIQPGALIENKFVLYAGPSHAPLLKEFGYGLEETINYGMFGGISKILLSGLRFSYSLVRNWGISIIILSVFLNIILFPLTNKSFKSMKKMQELHPQMEKIKAQHKSNPQKMNKEIMELYKKYNINPFSGCLPMLLQMPIFFALYQALIKSIELRGASFLWIKDLSMPDAVPIPITLPIFGNHINVLPIFMIIAMVIQQKISTKSMGGAVTEEQKQQQKMMLVMMPVMFGFIFYSMPSGLVLYWVVNTILTIVEQGAMLKNE